MRIHADPDPQPCIKMYVFKQQPHFFKNTQRPRFGLLYMAEISYIRRPKPRPLFELKKRKSKHFLPILGLKKFKTCLDPVSCLLSPISHLLSPISRLPSPVSHLPSPISCLPSPVFCLLSPVLYKCCRFNC